MIAPFNNIAYLFFFAPIGGKSAVLGECIPS
jgi:hypothetical protein